MANFNMSLSTARNLVSHKRFVVISFDVEAFELDHSAILEIGWTIMDPRPVLEDGSKKRVPLFLDRHFCIKEYRHLKNGRYVDDRRDNFNFGTSVWASLKEAVAEFENDIKLTSWSLEMTSLHRSVVSCLLSTTSKAILST